MNRIFSLTGLAATSTILMTTTALADITASQVWQAWQEDAAHIGMTLAASNVTESSDGLELSALEVTATIPALGEIPNPIEIRFNIGSVTLQDNGDGSVAVIWPDSQEGVVSVTMGKDGGALSFESTAAGRLSTISGSIEEMQYATAVDNLSWNISDWSVSSDEISTADLANIVFEASGMMEGATANTVVTRTDGWQAVTTGQTAKSSYAFKFETPQAEANQSQSQTQLNAEYEASLTLPANLDFTKPEGIFEALSAGLALSAKGTTGEVRQQQTQMSPMGEVTSDLVSQGMKYDMSINGTLANMTGEYGATTVNVTNAMLPPIDIAASGLEVDMQVPLTNDARMRYMIALRDLTVNDALWGMFDPTALLSRDPAQIVLDLTGAPAWEIDALDLSAWEAAIQGGILPLMPSNFSLDAFEITAAGASLTGTGEMNINYDDVAKGGEPKPAGAIDLSMSGLNALLDNLIAMGLLPEEQAMGGRMMLGLFAVPGEGEDTLKSRLEINEEGQIFANGQRLK